MQHVNNYVYNYFAILQVLIPLLLQALQKYNLIEQFSSVVRGFCNTSEAISELGDKQKITSLSLRSLCKTVLADTGLATASAVDRCQVLVNIMATITNNCDPAQASCSVVIPDTIVKFTTSVSFEEKQLVILKNVLGKQVSCFVNCS